SGGQRTLLGMAGASTIPRVRCAAGRLAVVRLAAAVWQCRRLHCADALLFFTRDDSQQRHLVYSARNRRGVGRVRGHFHRHSRSAHVVCPARSGDVELATHCITRAIAGAGDRIAILADHCDSPGARIHVVFGARSPRCCCGDLGRSLRHRLRPYFRVLLLPAGCFLAGVSSRDLSRTYVEGVRHDYYISATVDAGGADEPSARSGDARGAGRLSAVATGAVLRQHRAAAAGGAFPRSGPRDATLSGTRFPIRGGPILVRVRRRGGCGFARNTKSQPGTGLPLGAVGGERTVELDGASAGAAGVSGESVTMLTSANAVRLKLMEVYMTPRNCRRAISILTMAVLLAPLCWAQTGR